ncbi:GNAT family N-acetyltransferase [Streptomyces sp. MST-110588]|uniref:GNAT family N-acetyltransferase n=1 Tax=Streptomyces sp. MST-110588 TaxID=2833628 RepID=UPI001F5E1C0E|nr:GNAT family N-acetyltransferase [Streptomyces sp. MST-110588]UNO43585.1 N-acetyltransferase [Streptomyces sp. MST-110588]
MTVLPADIRSAGPADLDAVAEIFEHYVSHTVITFEQTPPTVAEWRRRFDDLTGRGLPFLVAELDGEVAGYAYAGPWRPKPAYRYTVEDTVYLAPHLTGKGLGGALLEALLTRCVQAGLRQMVAVIADTGNGASIALHRRSGFTHAGRLTGVGHKHGRSVDTVLMQRSLITRQEG